MAPLWTDCLQTQRSSWCLTGQVPPWFWTHATRFSTLVFCSKGLWATKQPRFWLVWQRESKLLQLLGFLAGIIAGNLLGINSKLISRLKSISSFPAINGTTLTKTNKAGIKFDKIWPFYEDYQYLPIPSIHNQSGYWTVPSTSLFPNIQFSALMTINYLYCHGLHPRSFPLSIFQMHLLAHPVPKQAHDIHIWAENPFPIQIQHQENRTPGLSPNGFLLMAGEMPFYKILIYLLR